MTEKGKKIDWTDERWKAMLIYQRKSMWYPDTLDKLAKWMGLEQGMTALDIGCGLGTQLWAGNEGLVPKVLGATTNGTFGNQTFGITTGTLGCSQEGVITADARLRMFAGANLDNLARDMAGERQGFGGHGVFGIEHSLA